jgi:osmotically-inducible protein OsmY
MRNTSIPQLLITRLLIIGAAALFTAALSIAPAAAAGSAAQNDQVTAQQQSNRMSDLDITRNIRRAIMKNKSLSVHAHNVAIITRHGKVTLRGQVDSSAEKEAVESAAATIAGPGNVTDELTISPQ